MADTKAKQIYEEIAIGRAEDILEDHVPDGTVRYCYGYDL